MYPSHRVQKKVLFIYESIHLHLLVILENSAPKMHLSQIWMSKHFSHKGSSQNRQSVRASLQP